MLGCQYVCSNIYIGFVMCFRVDMAIAWHVVG